MEYRKIREICEWHAVDPLGAELFNEGWILSRTGDMIGGMNWSYGIYDNNLLGCNWPTHLAEKVWFSPELFVPAYAEALRRAGIEEAVVNWGEGNETFRPGEHGLMEKIRKIRRFMGRIYANSC